MRKIVEEKIDSYQDEILDFAKKLIAVQTEDPPGRAYRECIELIGAKLSEIGIESRVIEVHERASSKASGETRDKKSNYPRFCLLGSFGSGKKILYFHGHYDVVPASSPEQFCPRVKEGKLFGRGSSDMKGGLASMIHAVKAIKESRVQLDGRIVLVIVPDEEIGGCMGTQYLARSGLLERGALGMFTAEPTEGVIWNASRGAISLRITIKGKPAHVALHYQGINAFESMVTAADALLEHKKKIEKRKTKFAIEPDEARNSILLIGGICEGGTNFNVVPSECAFTIDRRINPEEDLEEEKMAIFGILEALKRDGIELEAELLQEGYPGGVPEDAPAGRALAWSASEITGGVPRFELCPGLLETRFYAHLGIPAYAYGPGLLHVSHGPDEHVLLKDLLDCTKIYALAAMKMFGVSLT